jgi:predicted neuraminidase
MKFSFASLLALIVFSSVAIGEETFEDGGVIFNYKPTLIYDFKSENGYAREPVLARMPNGDLICFHYTGEPREPAQDNLVMISRSGDNGKTWSKPEILFEHPHRAVWATEIFTGGEKPIAFIHSFLAETIYSEIQSFMTTTDDNGHTWSDPVTIPGNGKNVSVRKGIVLENGDWVFPVYWHEVNGHWGWKSKGQDKPRPFKPQLEAASGVLISSDQGKTFSIHGYVEINKVWVWEPNVVEITPNHLVMLASCKDRLVRSESLDGGITWSEAVISDIPNPESKIDLSVIEGKVVLIFNSTGKTGWFNRNTLDLWVSNDGCKSWKKKICLAKTKPKAKTVFTYPHTVRDDKDRELIIACENARKHWIIRVPYTDFLD